MLEGISSKITVSALPVASALVVAAGVVVGGRKIAMGASLKVAGAVANLVDKKIAKEWNNNGDAYLKAAKKDALRDLTIGASLVAAGLTANIWKTEQEEEVVVVVEPSVWERGYDAVNAGVSGTANVISSVHNFVVQATPYVIGGTIAHERGVFTNVADLVKSAYSRSFVPAPTVITVT